MFTTLVKNRICRGKSGFCCTICNVDINDKETAFTHISDDENHLEKLANITSLKNFKINEKTSIEFVYNGIVPTSSREFKCTFCSCPIPKFDHIPEHIVGKKHLSKRRKVLPDSEFHNEISLYNDQISTDETNCNSSNVQKEPENTVSHEDQTMKHTFFCSHCQDSLQTNTALMYHKMFHLSSQNYQRSDIISFYIRENTKRIYCLICDCTINNEEDLENHLKETCHIKRMMILCCPNKNTIVSMTYLSSFLFPNIAIPPDITNIYNTLNAEFNRYLYYLGCNIHYNTFQQPVVQTNHMNEHEMVSTNTSQVYNQQNIPQNTEHFFSFFSTFYCFLCSTKFLDENLLFLHYEYDYVHKYRLETINLILRDKNMKFDTYLDNEVIKCLKCQIQLTELNGAVMHLFEIQHIVENNKTITDNVYLVNDANNANMSTNMYICPICKINVTHDYMMVQHLESDYHKTRVQEYYANVNSGSFEKIIFFCPECNMNFFSDRTLLDHLYVSHPKQVTNVIHTNNMMLTNPANIYLPPNNGLINGVNTAASLDMQQYFYTKYINSIPPNEAHQFHNFINPNFSKDYQQKVQADLYKQRNSHMQNNERTTTTSTTSNLTKNLINFSPRYVKLCVEIGEENIFKMNPDRIKKLQLGISLTFPYDSNRGCIPCGCEISKDPQYLYEHLRSSEHEKNLRELEENDEFFENYRDQFSDLELAKSYMYEDSDEWIKCLSCNTLIENHDEVVHDHISSSLHIKNCQTLKKSSDEISNLFNNIFENLWYYIEKYFCNICCAHFEFEVDYARHLESPKHLKEVERRILRKQSLQFDCCILCSSFWYAKSDHHSIHCERDSHKYILKSRDFTVPEMPDSAKNLLTCVEKTVNSLLLESDEICNSVNDVEKKILESIERIIRFKFPKVKAYLFGSRTSYLGSPDSDLDIYVDCENQYEKLLPKEETQDQLIAAQACFHKYQDLWIIEDIVVCTRVPIIRLRHRNTNLNCDISFINGLSVEKSKIVGYYVKAYLPCRKLILFLKKWNNLCRLSGRKKINTFAITWMVIFYLQIKGILPSVYHLIKQENASKIVAGWETGVSKTIPVEETDLTFEELLQGFFLYYAEFDYISDIACPFLGKIIKKSKLSDIDDLPEEMNIYKTLIKKEEIEFFRLDSPMCIQEPIDLSQNITKAVTKLHLRMFRQYCAESAVSLKAAEDDDKT